MGGCVWVAVLRRGIEVMRSDSHAVLAAYGLESLLVDLDSTNHEKTCYEVLPNSPHFFVSDCRDQCLSLACCVRKTVDRVVAAELPAPRDRVCPGILKGIVGVDSRVRYVGSYAKAERLLQQGFTSCGGWARLEACIFG